MPRYFTLDEARASLPVVGRSIREAVHCRTRYQEAQRAIQNLTQRILMLGGVSVDTAAAEAWKNQYDSNGQSLRNAMERIEEIGVIVKDLDVGLVDFPTLFRGEEVYLCWRMDENDIDHWHGVNEGFSGRKTIDRNFLENHRGDGVSTKGCNSRQRRRRKRYSTTKNQSLASLLKENKSGRMHQVHSPCESEGNCQIKRLNVAIFLLASDEAESNQPKADQAEGCRFWSRGA